MFISILLSLFLVWSLFWPLVWLFFYVYFKTTNIYPYTPLEFRTGKMHGGPSKEASEKFKAFETCIRWNTEALWW